MNDVTDSRTVLIDGVEVLILAYMGGMITACSRVDDLDTWGPATEIAR